MHSLSITNTLLGLLAVVGVHAAYPITSNTGGFNVTGQGDVPDRLEINVFAARGGPQWDLFVLCMAEIQARPQNQIDSWYQIAGIHGRPYAAWDGVGSAPGSHAGGYCPHSSVLFPTWHRPYVQLLEQNIWQCAQARAVKYPTSTRTSYVNAAETLRFTYWDWVANPVLPPIVTQPSITVTDVSGKVTIPNPLFQYSFKNKRPGGPGTSDFPGYTSAPQKYQQTVRQPSKSTGATNTAAANAALQRQAGYLHDTTYLILTQTTSYAEMSNNGYQGSTTGYGSIENPHGTVHSAVGGVGGHMSYLDYSSFDPIFWLHHCNVDRIFSLWQAVHYDQWDINQRTSAGSFAVTANTVETETTKLYPFSQDKAGNLYTSVDARYTVEDFGYTYPEIRPWGKEPEELAAEVRANIRALYDPSGNLDRRRRSKNAKRAAAGVGNDLETRATDPIDPSNALVNGKYKSWSLNLEVDKFSLEKSFNVFFFMGSPTTHSSQWLFDNSLVAQYPVNRPQAEGLTTLTIYGTIPLTRSMLHAVDNGVIDNLEVDQATPYLKKNLVWRLADYDGNEIEVAKVPSLKVFVVDQEVTPPKGASDFPDYGVVTPHLNVTLGKLGSVIGGDGILAKIGFKEFVKSVKGTVGGR
ncbi:common central domain of tyrosinase-domain-containing protein [Pseudomassariella vexata]|uniref:tyrosinase n=1 Tax=Pseudomassariella vexata TaxID=1141098 RepID=A0A1Y2ELF4_9PEZI|nr:common central domain of tyrosinase-domain-containing protein [Pseudomassariella vexata]ORY72106.1 common central domain of tyrosinase-domain-containing protein [Pseudomassariella vexata]